jgi:uncharacterized membrane protein
MQIFNPFQLNNWEIKKCYIFLFSLQFAFFGLIVLNAYGIHLSILIQLIGFIYLTFVPGILLIRIFKLHKLTNITFLLYAVGLSLTTLMFTGFCINLFFPLYGIFRPISLWPLVCSISIVVVILSIFAFIRDQAFSFPEYIQLEEIITKPVLILLLFPITAIVGTEIFNSDGNNIILMVITLFIALIPVVIFFTKFFQEKYYPYIIFILSITLLYSHSLISSYIWGWDINHEYYFVNTVIQNGIWDSTIFHVLNAMLSLTMLGPIYSLILNMSLDGVFKIIYPFLFSLVPLGLYEIFKKQTDSKVAFLACFFFISFFTFYTEMLALARQEIAELFVVLIILSLIDNNLNNFTKTVFFILFSFSLIVSHYGTSYLFLLILLISWTTTTVGHYLISRKYTIRFFLWFQGKSGYQSDIYLKKGFSRSKLLSFSHLILYSVFLLIWYIFTAGSTTFDEVVLIGNHIVTSTFTEFLNPETSQGLSLITSTHWSLFHEIAKYIHILTIILIVIGFLSSVVLYKKVQFDLQFLLLSFGALCLCVGGVVLPFFSSSLNTTRVYQISLIFLAPFCILGGIAVFKVISIFFNKSTTNNNVKISLRVLSIFFTVFLLINSSWFYLIANEEPGGLWNKNLDFPWVDAPQLAGATWLIDLVNAESIYADLYRILFFNRINGPWKVKKIPKDPNKMPDESYVFLGDFNIIKNKVMVNKDREYTDANYILTNRSRIYDSGSAEVYYQ